MLKKILYIIVSIVLGFVIFYIAWRESYSKAVVNRGNDALKEENYEFFCKFLDYYEKDPIIVSEYKENNNTTTLRAYNVYSKRATDENGKKTNRSGLLFLITDINLDEIMIDEDEPSDDITDEDLATRITFTSNTGSTYTYVLSTYGYESAPIVLTTLSTSDTLTEFTKGDIKEVPAKLTHITITDCSDKKTVMYDGDVNIDLVEHNDEAYWTNLVNEGKAGVSFTAKEYRTNFSFAFPEMTKTLVITGVTILILIGLGVFIFWPKKTFVPNEDEDREKYTFATTEDKNKYALEKIARDKREKEERENRYRNVRSESSLENITNEKVEASLDKENTFDAAIKEDKELEENNDSNKQINEDEKEEN